MSNHIIQCNDTGCVHCELGRCTCWKIELTVDMGSGLLYCNTYTPKHMVLPSIPLSEARACDEHNGR